jgi:hypothetical protein
MSPFGTNPTCPCSDECPLLGVERPSKTTCPGLDFALFFPVQTILLRSYGPLACLA